MLFPFPSPRGAGPVVLIAHSDQRQAARLVSLLDEALFRPVVAGDGASARRVLGTSKVDALFMEAALPGALAFEWIPELRRSPPTRGLPIILVGSLYNLESYRRRPVDLLGADGYVEEVSHASVVEGLEAVLAGKARRRRVVEASR